LRGRHEDRDLSARGDAVEDSRLAAIDSTSVNCGGIQEKNYARDEASSRFSLASQQLSNIRSLLGKTDAIREARALLAEQFGKFTLSRVKDEHGWSYKAVGWVDFSGTAWYAWMVPGARHARYCHGCTSEWPPEKW